MLKLLLVAGLFFPLFALVACGKSENQKTQEQVDDGKAKLSRMDSINIELLNKGIVIQTKPGMEAKGSEYSKIAMQKMSTAQLEKARQLLAEYVAHGRQVLSLVDSGKATYSGGRPELAKYVQNAEALFHQASKIGAPEIANANSRIDRMNELNGLLVNKGIVVLPKPGYEAHAMLLSKEALKNLKATELKATRNLLQEYERNGREVLKSIDSGNYTAEQISRTNIESSANNADALAQEVERLLATK